MPKKRELDLLTWDVWLSSRFLHVRVAVHTGITTLHVPCVYGLPNGLELNAELWDSVLQYATRLENALFLIGAISIF